MQTTRVAPIDLQLVSEATPLIERKILLLHQTAIFLHLIFEILKVNEYKQQALSQSITKVLH